MGFDPLTVMAVGSVLGLGTSLVQGNAAKKRQEGAQDRAEREAKKTADLQDQAMNKANAKKPNLGGLYRDNSLAGQSGTLLTSPSGIDTSKMQLGKTTLLGG
jgi:hypothetical protein